MSLRSFWAAIAVAGLGITINVATDLKDDWRAWLAVPVLAVLAHWLTSQSVVLSYEQRNGNAITKVSVNDKDVATELLKHKPFN